MTKMQKFSHPLPLFVVRVIIWAFIGIIIGVDVENHFEGNKDIRLIGSAGLIIIIMFSLIIMPMVIDQIRSLSNCIYISDVFLEIFFTFLLMDTLSVLMFGIFYILIMIVGNFVLYAFILLIIILHILWIIEDAIGGIILVIISVTCAIMGAIIVTENNIVRAIIGGFIGVIITYMVLDGVRSKEQKAEQRAALLKEIDSINVSPYYLKTTRSLLNKAKSEVEKNNLKKAKSLIFEAKEMLKYEKKKNDLIKEMEDLLRKN